MTFQPTVMDQERTTGSAVKSNPSPRGPDQRPTVSLAKTPTADGTTGPIAHERFGLDHPPATGPQLPVDRRPVVAVRERPPRNPGWRAATQVLAILAVLLLGFLVEITLLGGLQHQREQAQAFRELRIQLAIGTAPVGPLDVDGAPLAPGAPVAILEIPALGLTEVVLEGTSSRTTMSGAGHRRDTVLPGQAGVSVVAGRRGAYGGPFAHLDELQPGQEIVVRTGQGRHVFAVLGIRRAGDPLPTPLVAGQGRLTLTTADGQPFQPTDLLRVDALLTSPAQAVGPLIPTRALPANEAVPSGDPTVLLTLMLWGPLLIAAALGVVWIRHRAGGREAWLIGVPVLGLLGLLVADSAAALLPNVL